MLQHKVQMEDRKWGFFIQQKQSETLIMLMFCVVYIFCLCSSLSNQETNKIFLLSVQDCCSQREKMQEVDQRMLEKLLFILSSRSDKVLVRSLK